MVWGALGERASSPAMKENRVFHQSRRGRLLSQEGDKVPHTILISLARRNSRVAPPCARCGENGIMCTFLGGKLLVWLVVRNESR